MLHNDLKIHWNSINFISINQTKRKPMNENQTEKTESTDESPEMIRRDFLKKFGKYAVATPVVTYTLMSSKTSKANGSYEPE
jgi:hypothetical protein